MKKRLGSVVILTLLAVLMSFNTVFAAGLTLTDSSPEDNQRRVEPKNVMIKLFFNEDVSGSETQTLNKNCFKLKSTSGTAVSFDILYDSKDSKKICLNLNEDLDSKTVYKLTISGDLIADSGNTLDTDKVITFTTRNSDADGTVNMILMLIMVGAMVFFTMRSTKKAMSQQEETEGPSQPIPTNPYKYAKEKGISVEAAQKEIAELKKKEEERKARKAAEEAREAKKEAIRKERARQAELEAQRLANRKVCKVKTKRRVKYKK